MKKKLAILSVLSTATLAVTMVFAAKPELGTLALMNRQSAGTSTEYSASLILRADYDSDTKYFGYNSETHFANETTPIEYTLSWVNGNSQQFSIYNGSKYLDINPSSTNNFIESDTPVYWGHSDKGIGRTVNGTTKYLYYNNSYPRVAPYVDKTADNRYSIAYFYTSDQLTAWQGHCSGEFAEACLTTLISGNFIPSEGTTPTPTPTEGIIILPSDGSAVTESDYTIIKNGITVSVNASTLTSEQIRVFKGKTITISSESNITKIEFTCTANGTTKYGPGCFAAQSGYIFEASGKKGTWTGSSTSVSFIAESNQVRITQIVVTL